MFNCSTNCLCPIRVASFSVRTSSLANLVIAIDRVVMSILLLFIQDEDWEESALLGFQICVRYFLVIIKCLKTLEVCLCHFGQRKSWGKPERFPIPYLHFMNNNTQSRILYCFRCCCRLALNDCLFYFCQASAGSRTYS